MDQHLKFQPVATHNLDFIPTYYLQRELLALKSAQGQRIIYAARPITANGPFKTSNLQQACISILDKDKFWLKLQVDNVPTEFYYFVTWNAKEKGWDYQETYFFQQVPAFRVFIRNILRIGAEYRLARFGIL